MTTVCQTCRRENDDRREHCHWCGATIPSVRSELLLADALDAIRALMMELENYTMVHGADEDDEHALALGREVMRKANNTAHLRAEKGLYQKANKEGTQGNRCLMNLKGEAVQYETQP